MEPSLLPFDKAHGWRFDELRAGRDERRSSRGLGGAKAFATSDCLWLCQPGARRGSGFAPVQYAGRGPCLLVPRARRNLRRELAHPTGYARFLRASRAAAPIASKPSVVGSGATVGVSGSLSNANSYSSTALYGVMLMWAQP